MITVTGMLMAAGLRAQSIQEGVNHLYADRFKTAVSVFEKLIAAKLTWMMIRMTRPVNYMTKPLPPVTMLP